MASPEPGFPSDGNFIGPIAPTGMFGFAVSHIFDFFVILNYSNIFIMDQNLFYCDYETCMSLKQKGFNEMCDAFYGDAFLHNGEYISPDHEYEYRIEGKKVDVEHGGWVYKMNSRNGDEYMDDHSCSIVSHPVAMKWLFGKTGIFISVKPYATTEGFFYSCNLLELRKLPNDMGVYSILGKSGFDNPENAYEYGIKEILKLFNN